MSASIREVHIRPYRLRLKTPWRTARDLLLERRGWLVTITAENFTGYGDCAPMPNMGTESFPEAEAWLNNTVGQLPGSTVDALLDSLPLRDCSAVAARCGVEMALLDLCSRMQKLPLHKLIAPQSIDTVPVNHALGSLAQVTPDALAGACNAGASVLKVKLGMAAPEHELLQLNRLVDQLQPGCRLRLDANGAWDLSTARHMLEGLQGLPIEAVEEPLRGADLRELQQLQSEAPFPLALDESLGQHDPHAVIKARAVRRLVLKPLLLGGLLPTRDLALRAHHAGMEVVLTSLLESSAGIWPTAQLAATLPSTSAAPAHGLATGDWLRDDLGTAPPIQSGRLQLGTRAGSGFEPDIAWRQ